MNPSHDPLEQAIRQDFERREAQIDARWVLAGVRHRMKQQPQGRSIWNQALRWGSGLAVAAAILVAVLWVMPSSVATAETIVQQVVEALATPVDRKYEIKTEWETGWANKFPLLAIQRKNTLWTRGDRFMMESILGEHRSVWGRDEEGRIWIALNQRFGVVFNPDEVGDGVNFISDIMEMKLESLLNEMLLHCRLQKEEIPGQPNLVRIIGTPKSLRGANRLRSITLKVDTVHKVVQQVIVKRNYNGQFAATVTFTLTESQQRPDEQYQLSGHLDAEGKILGPEQSRLRNLLWKRVVEKKGLEWDFR